MGFSVDDDAVQAEDRRRVHDDLLRWMVKVRVVGDVECGAIFGELEPQRHRPVDRRHVVETRQVV